MKKRIGYMPPQTAAFYREVTMGRGKNKRKGVLPRLPHGTKTMVARAFEIALAALEGREINPMPSRRPYFAAKLRRARTILLREGYIWP